MFRLARETSACDADFHVDFADEPEHLDVRYIAEQTVRHGWQGRSRWATSPSSAPLPPPAQDEIYRRDPRCRARRHRAPRHRSLSDGAGDSHKVRRGLAPVKRLLAAGVPVAAATNKVRNAFTPVGTANLPLMGFLVSVACHMGTRPDLLAAIHMLTEHPARILGRGPARVAPDAAADLVVRETERAEDVIAAMAPPLFVIKRGRVTVEHRPRIDEPVEDALRTRHGASSEPDEASARAARGGCGYALRVAGRSQRSLVNQIDPVP